MPLFEVRVGFTQYFYKSLFVMKQAAFIKQALIPGCNYKTSIPSWRQAKFCMDAERGRGSA